MVAYKNLFIDKTHLFVFEIIVFIYTILERIPLDTQKIRAQKKVATRFRNYPYLSQLLIFISPLVP